MFFTIMVTVKMIVPMAVMVCIMSSITKMVANEPAQLINSDSLGFIFVLVRGELTGFKVYHTIAVLLADSVRDSLCLCLLICECFDKRSLTDRQ